MLPYFPSKPIYTNYHIYKNHDTHREIKKEINTIKELIKVIVDEHYPSKGNKEIISLHDLITLGILAHLHFNGVIMHGYTHFIEEELFPKIR